MNDNKVKIGIVGCGNIAPVHAEAISSTNYGILISVFSRSESNINKMKDRFNVAGYDDYEKFLSDPNLDAVSICTPNGTHLEFAEMAAKAGKHVVIEKPIEVDIRRAKRIIDICNKNNVKLAVIYQNRFLDDVIKMKNVIDKGVLGKIFMSDARIKWYRDQQYYDSAQWRGSFKLDGGGVLINQAIHTIDLWLWMLGEPKTIFAHTGTFTHNNIEGEDNAVAVVEFRNGSIGVLQGSTSIIPAMKRRIEIHGENGTGILDGDVFYLLDNQNKVIKEDNNSINTGGASPLAGFSIEHHKKQFEQIFDAIINNKKPVVSGEESLKSLAFVKAVYESAKNRTEVNYDEYLAGQ